MLFLRGNHDRSKRSQRNATKKEKQNLFDNSCPASYTLRKPACLVYTRTKTSEDRHPTGTRPATDQSREIQRCSPYAERSDYRQSKQPGSIPPAIDSLRQQSFQ